jgi:hypothetical protein
VLVEASPGGERQQRLPQRGLASAVDGVGAAAAGGLSGGNELLVGEGGERDRLHGAAFRVWLVHAAKSRTPVTMRAATFTVSRAMSA